MTAQPALHLADMADIHRRAALSLRRSFPGLQPEVRDELVQDGFVSLLERLREGPLERPAGWVIRAAWFAAQNWWRDCGRRARHGVSWEDADLAAFADPLARLDGWRLALLLVSAPAHHRQVLDHMYLREGEVEELATAEGITEHAVYQRHAKALAWLRDAAGVPRAPRQLQAQLQATVDQRRARIVEHLRTRPGWHRTGPLREELQALLRCTRNELSGDLMGLKRDGVLAVRGARKQAEYRLQEGT